MHKKKENTNGASKGNKTGNVLYMVTPSIGEQRDAINAHCFGDCRKILMEAWDLGSCVGYACEQDICPYVRSQAGPFKTELSEGINRTVVLRRLKEEKTE